ncbi:pyridoxamine 5'-phosphate oxidase family protein [Streptomyces marincola]|uniref:pyridoxamine 5'-phosphate oxidase family protein n=1 Tax=Streptomyces marincola TaxID=2878388 RepID=UPI001CF44E56|nr:TIGR03618 family F420-dependent PPOX class oxidoreductase [Streptomyces marincola]UCM91250.1 TIGR03618 family F420-dependent PPOX class oxidoreductase [Streptomyces marincola]
MTAPQPDPDQDFLAFWRERHLGVLAIPRAAGGIHLAPVGVTYDHERRLARVITSGASHKVRHLAAAGERARVSVCQVDGARWSTLEGTATVTSAPEAVAEAERRYTERYRRPRVNPRRVAIEITVTRVMGSVRPGG